MDYKRIYKNETGKTPTYYIPIGYLANQPMSTEDYTKWLEKRLTELEKGNAELVKYAKHEDSCPLGRHGVDHAAGRYGDCSCGLKKKKKKNYSTNTIQVRR